MTSNSLHAAVKLRSSSLLMTCCVLVFGSDGMPVEVRALLDNGSTSSFVSECLVQSLRLPHSQHRIPVSGISGSSASSPIQSVANFKIFSTHTNGRKIDLTTIVLSRVWPRGSSARRRYQQGSIFRVLLADAHRVQEFEFHH